MAQFNIIMSREFLSDLMKLPPAVYPRALRTVARASAQDWLRRMDNQS